MPDRLRQAVNIQTMDHRSPGFAELLASLQSDLGKVIKTTSGQVLTFPASGTGGREPARVSVVTMWFDVNRLRNHPPPGENVLSTTQENRDA